MDEKNMETEPDKSYLHQQQQQQTNLYTSSGGNDEKMSSSSNPTTTSTNPGVGGGGGGGDHLRGGISHGHGAILMSNNNNNNNNNNDDNDVSMRNGVVVGQRIFGGGQIRSMDDAEVGMTSGSRSGSTEMLRHHHHHRSSRACPSPVSSIVGTALNQMHLKRSSSAPMINQLGIGAIVPETMNNISPSSTPSSGSLPHHSSSAGNKESIADLDAYASSFLSSLGGRPRRFSASFSPAGSPGPAPNRVSQLRQENTADWETMSEKEFHGTINIAQSWEDLSLDSMSVGCSNQDSMQPSWEVVGTRRPSISDQLWLSMPPSSAPSSPAASPRVMSRFSPSLSSPSPTRKSFTTRRSLSPIAVRPSVLAIGQQGVKRKCDWDSNGSSSNQMDCSPQPAKRPGLLSSFNAAAGGSASPVSQFSSPSSTVGPGGGGYPFSYSNTGVHQQYFPLTNNPSSSSSSSHQPQQQQQQQQPQHSSTSPFNPNNSSTSSNSLMSMITNHVEDSPFSNETESSVSSIGGCDSPFFRPVDSPLASVTTSPDDSPRPSHPKI